MSKPNGRDNAIANLASALQRCLDVASESAAERAADRVKSELEPRLDRQDATLRMIWTQCGGKADQRLPIDD